MNYIECYGMMKLAAEAADPSTGVETPYVSTGGFRVIRHGDNTYSDEFGNQLSSGDVLQPTGNDGMGVVVGKPWLRKRIDASRMDSTTGLLVGMLKGTGTGRRYHIQPKDKAVTGISGNAARMTEPVEEGARLYRQRLSTYVPKPRVTADALDAYVARRRGSNQYSRGQ